MHEDNIAKTRACTEKDRQTTRLQNACVQNNIDAKRACTEKDRQLADMKKLLAETKASEEMANMMVGPLVSIVLRGALPPKPSLCSQAPPPNLLDTQEPPL